MTDQNRQHQQQSGSAVMDRAFTNLDQPTAQALLREASIGRQQQSGRLSAEDEENIRMGRQDQSIGYDDAVFALTNIEKVWPQVQQSLGKQT